MGIYDNVEIIVDGTASNYEVKDVNFISKSDEDLNFDSLSSCNSCGGYGIKINSVPLKMNIGNGIFVKPNVRLCDSCLKLAKKEVNNRLPKFICY